MDIKKCLSSYSIDPGEEGYSSLVPGNWCVISANYIAPNPWAFLSDGVSFPLDCLAERESKLQSKFTLWARRHRTGDKFECSGGFSAKSLVGASSWKFTWRSWSPEWWSAEWKLLPSFWCLWYQLKCLLESLGTMLIMVNPDTFCSGQEGLSVL